MFRLRFVIASVVASVVAVVLGMASAQASVVITVDKAAQRLTVVVDGVQQYDWAVSTGRWGYNTPEGTYRPERLERTWYSSKYNGSPMPYSIFFKGGYAIHGSNEISRLGRPASHGCIRLHPGNAATLFSLVGSRRGDTRIVITGGDPNVMTSSVSSSFKSSSAKARGDTVYTSSHVYTSNGQVRRKTPRYEVTYDSRDVVVRYRKTSRGFTEVFEDRRR